MTAPAHDDVTRLAVSLTPGGLAGGGWGRADRVALVDVDAGGEVIGWTEHDVGWGAAHPASSPAGPGGAGGPTPLPFGRDATPPPDSGHGAHHARITRFVRDHGVQIVVTGHMGPGMTRVMSALGVAVVLGAAGDPRQAAATAWTLTRVPPPA